MHQAAAVEGVLKHGGGIKVALPPARQVLGMRQQVTFIVVTACVGKDKIVTKVNRVSRPGDEVIGIACYHLTGLPQ